MFMRAVLGATIALVSIQASAVEVGQRLMCNRWEGTIDAKYSGGEYEVRWDGYYDDGVRLNENKVTIQNIRHCSMQLPDETPIGRLQAKVGDELACNDYLGKIDSVYEKGIARVTFTSLVEKGQMFNRSYVDAHTVDHCARKLTDDEASDKGIEIGETILCNDYKGQVASVYSDGRALVRFTQHIRGGQVLTTDLIFLQKIGHCQRQLN